MRGEGRRVGVETDHEVWFVPAKRSQENYLFTANMTGPEATSLRDRLNADEYRPEGEYVAVKVTTKRSVLT